jgi:nucleoside-diphosphate-sugar epimerase
MKVLITGGAGFLGLRLAKRLLGHAELTGTHGEVENIDSLVLADASPPKTPGWRDDRVEFVRSDIGDRKMAFELIDRDEMSVFHLASIMSAEAEADLDLAFRVNVEGTRNLLDALRERGGCQRFVVTSSYAVFGGELPEVVSDRT